MFVVFTRSLVLFLNWKEKNNSGGSLIGQNLFMWTTHLGVADFCHSPPPPPLSSAGE